MNLNIVPVEVNEQILNMLEDRGVIRRIIPGKDVLPVAMGESKHASVYESDSKFGPHKLITVTINSTEPKKFVYHNDHEDFMLIDLPDRTSLIITMSLIDHEKLQEKINNQTVSSDDFIAVKFKPNDPFSSFFTMCKGYPHVETCEKESMKPPSFYVTECRDLDEQYIDFNNYKLKIEV